MRNEPLAVHAGFQDDPTTPADTRPIGATVGAVAAFAVAGAVAIIGVVLIIH